MMLSKKTYYALKALVALGKANGTVNSPVLIQTLIEQEGLPKKFLESILLSLKQGGFVNSRMGKGGGYYLARHADEDHAWFGVAYNRRAAGATTLC